MQFLFETIAFLNEKPAYYRIYNIEGKSYFVENMNEEGGFYLSQIDNEWVAKKNYDQNTVEQIGEEIDKYMLQVAKKEMS